MSRPNGDSPPRMRGATASVAGSRGAVPKPTAGQHNFMLLGDGTWGAQPIAGLPSQTSNSGKLLTTDGTNAAWTTTGVLTSLTSPASTALTLGTTDSGAAITVLAASNNVGIGTVSAGAKLDVNGAVRFENNLSFYPSDAYTVAQARTIDFYPKYTSSGSQDALVSQIKLMRTSTSDNTYDGELAFLTRVTGDSIAEAMRINKSRNVLIGTTDATGLTGAGGLKINSSTAGSANAGALVVTGGISAGQSGQASYFGGTVTTGGSATIGGTTVSIQAAGGGAANLDFLGNTGSPVNARIQYDQIANTSGQLFFQTANAGSLTTKLTLSNTGAATFAGAVSTGGEINATTAGNTTIRLTGGAASLGRFIAADNVGDAGYLDYDHATDSWILRNASATTLTVSPTTATFAGAVAIGNSVAGSIAAPSTHKVSILIGGFQYYLLASNI